MTTGVLEPKIASEDYELRIADIDPDPDQPRLEVDDELADSIKQHGILKAIEVRPHPEVAERWLIVDGERRWRGAKKAGLTLIPAKVTFDVEGVNLADRMVRQIVHNTGKPLTPVEEAIAFKKIIDARRNGTPEQITVAEALKRKVITKDDAGSANPDDLVTVPATNSDPKYGPVQLARDLGLPKSTVTDRLAMMEIPSFWLDLIVKGPLQPSHVPILHKWRKVPEKYQLRALEKMKQGYRWPGGTGQYTKYKKPERIYVDDFERELKDAMYTYVKPLSEVPGYNGPTEKLEARQSYPRRVVVHAMDPSLWQPIARKRAAERAKKRKAAGGSSPRSQWERQEAERQARYQREEEARQRARKRIEAARPQVLAAFQTAVDTAKFATLRDMVVAEALPHNTPKAYAAIARKANTPEAVLRALAMATIAAPLNSHHQATYELPKLAKRWKVDVAKLLKADEPEEKEKQPMPAESGAKKERAIAGTSAVEKIKQELNDEGDEE